MPITVSGTSITFNDSTTQTTAFTGSGGVTSLNGQTGAITNTSGNAIGSYVNSASRIANLGIFSTTAGSNLLYYNEGNDTFLSMGLSGTWRFMGSYVSPNPSSNPNLALLYVRVS